MTPVDLFTQQERNRSRSRWLVVAFILFFAWLGFGGDWIAWMSTRDGEPGRYVHGLPWFGIVLTLVAAAVAAYAWKAGPRRVLWSTSAREVVEPATEAEQRFVNVVEEMAVASGLPGRGRGSCPTRIPTRSPPDTTNDRPISR
jgi:hypothetical protein